MTKLDRRAENIVERSWPEAEDDANRRRLARQVKGQLERNSVHGSEWNDHKKLVRRILRERKQHCLDANRGRRVQVRPRRFGSWGSATEMVIVDTRIRDGRVQYGFAHEADDEPQKWYPRSYSADWPHHRDRWRFVSDERGLEQDVPV